MLPFPKPELALCIILLQGSVLSAAEMISMDSKTCKLFGTCMLAFPLGFVALSWRLIRNKIERPDKPITFLFDEGAGDFVLVELPIVQNDELTQKRKGAFSPASTPIEGSGSFRSMAARLLQAMPHHFSRWFNRFEVPDF